MIKVALILPQQQMCDTAQTLLSQYKLDVVSVEVAGDGANSAPNRATELAKQGVEIIICRGVQAMQIRQAVPSVVVVDIRMTAQELGLIIMDLKRRLNCDRPRIGIIASSRMLCDVSSFSQLFDIDLRVYFVTEIREYAPAVERAAADGVQAIMGGASICALAQTLAIPSAYLESGRESIADALRTAERVAYGLTTEKAKTAQLQSLLDHESSGILQLDAGKRVIRANAAAEQLLQRPADQIVGRDAAELLPQLNDSAVTSALEENEAAFAGVFSLAGNVVAAELLPMPSGALVVLHHTLRLNRLAAEMRREMYYPELSRRITFDDFVHADRVTRDLVARAKLFAQYSSPILLQGETGVGKELLARCIHAAGPRSQNVFISLDCAGYSADAMDVRLFGTYTAGDDRPCMAELAQVGTLYLCNVDALSPELQYKLTLLIQKKLLRNNSNRTTPANVRVIASTSADLLSLVREGGFRSDLYYALSTFSLAVPPLRFRREDIPGWVNRRLEQLGRQYDRQITLSPDCLLLLKGYDWPGNLDELRSVCDQIAMLSPGRAPDAAMIRSLLEQISPEPRYESGSLPVSKDRRAAQLAELLHRYNGNRQIVADELGISKTTLWRWMKKYGIEDGAV